MALSARLATVVSAPPGDGILAASLSFSRFFFAREAAIAQARLLAFMATALRGTCNTSEQRESHSEPPHLKSDKRGQGERQEGTAPRSYFAIGRMGFRGRRDPALP